MSRVMLNRRWAAVQRALEADATRVLRVGCGASHVSSCALRRIRRAMLSSLWAVYSRLQAVCVAHSLDVTLGALDLRSLSRTH